jgi:hypothetical protein
VNLYRYVSLDEMNDSTRGLVLNILEFTLDYFKISGGELPRVTFYEKAEMEDENSFSSMFSLAGSYEYNREICMGDVRINVEYENWLQFGSTIIHELVHHVQKLDNPNIGRSPGWEYIFNYDNERIEQHANAWSREVFAAWLRERWGIQPNDADIAAFETRVQRDQFFTPERKQKMINNLKSKVNDEKKYRTS